MRVAQCEECFGDVPGRGGKVGGSGEAHFGSVFLDGSEEGGG